MRVLPPIPRPERTLTLSEDGIASDETGAVEALGKEVLRVREVLTEPEAVKDIVGWHPGETSRDRASREETARLKVTIRTLRKDITRLNREVGRGNKAIGEFHKKLDQEKERAGSIRETARKLSRENLSLHREARILGDAEARARDGRKFRLLTVIDEFTRRCMAVVVERRLNSDNVLHCLTELFVQHGPPDHIRSDNGSEFSAHAVRDWLGRIGVKTLYIEPGSPWENGYNESFNSKLRDEILNTEIFSTLKEAKVLIERWRHHYKLEYSPTASVAAKMKSPRAKGRREP